MSASHAADEVSRIGKERGWSDATIAKVTGARVPLVELRMWSWMLPDDRVDAQLEWYERLNHGDLRGRQATMADNERFSELWSSSAERIGDWEIVTERGPDAFAQYKLQEHVTLTVFAKGDTLVACVSWSRRNVWVDGRRLSVTYGQGLRVHDSFRRQGLGDQVRRFSWPAPSTRPNHTQYDIMRSQNFAVVDWWTKYNPDFFDETPKNDDTVPGIPISVAQIPTVASDGRTTGIRKARADDIPRCCELLNRTHEGLDLFRPYTEDFLEATLDEHFWGERPDFYSPIYCWDDYYVLEHEGRVVACAGLWDRGRDVRERWRRADTGKERTIADTNLLDWGYEHGATHAMAELVRALLARSHDLGRDHLCIGLDHQDALARELEPLGPVPEERILRWSMPGVALSRAYTDLRYW